MLGSVRDAEDLLQDAYLRWRDVDASTVRYARPFLITLISRLCIDRLRALKRERETYIGPWLPEPIPTTGLSGWSVGEPGAVASAHLEPFTQPEQHVERDRTLRLAVLRLLEHLTPEQRATYVLREAFAFSFDEIAETLQANVATCRQWFHRAQEHLAGVRRFEVREDIRATIIERLMNAIQSGNIAETVALMRTDVEVHTDGGGKAPAAIRVVTDPARIAQVLIHLWRNQQPQPRVMFGDTNNSTMAWLWIDDRLEAVVSVEIVDGLIQYIDIVRNPDKLSPFIARLTRWPTTAPKSRLDDAPD